MSNTYFYRSPIGWIKIEVVGKKPVSIQFSEIQDKREAVPPKAIDHALNTYFTSGDLNSKLAVRAEGTLFQKKIWNIVKSIPKGQTKTYLEIAKDYGNPKAIRAVANAIGKNPLLLFIPCHRVIGTDGSMTGYAGGIAKKKWLLEHEGVSIQKTLDLSF
jgi:methylated-DNA-[protein]-cysteine S-methyltransferase